MPVFAIQYLEDSPKIARLTPQAVRQRLQAAFERLPISLVLLGWNLPDALLDACAEECHRADAQLYRWHPLLTGDGTFVPRPEWQATGLSGDPVPGFRGMPEFTFVCPNRPAVQDAVFAHLRDVLRDPRYHGVFLDRIRYPSPAPNPASAFGCFCEDCQRAAAQEGLDLEAARRHIVHLIATPHGAIELVGTLLDPLSAIAPEPDLLALAAYLDFRVRSISRFVQQAARLVHETGRAVGLDCFSPALTRMVGQDLGTLDGCADWIKIMSYGHTLGPAGVPFELLGLADWLIEQHGVSEPQAFALLSSATQLPLPPDRDRLRAHGLPPEALMREAQRARQAGVRTVLAGIELVELEGVVQLHDSQIAADVASFREVGADGLALSWDLWAIPLDRLSLVRAAWT